MVAGSNVERVGDLMQTDVPRCLPHERVQEVHNRVVEQMDPSPDLCAVVDADDRLLGAVTSGELEFDSWEHVPRAMKESPGTLRPEDSLDKAIEHMRREGVDSVLVTSSDGIVVGVLERAAVERSRENARE